MKRKGRKGISLLLMLCMVLALLGGVVSPAQAAEASSVKVGGVVLNSGQYLVNGASAATTTQPADNYAYFEVNGGKATLTLHNYSYSGAGDSNEAINAKGDLTIVLVGGNSITHTGGGENSYGVFVDGSLTLQGSGSLVATGGDVDATTGYSCGVNVWGNVTISGGTVTATGGDGEATTGYSYGMKVQRVVTISDGTVTATGGTAAFSGGVEGDNITISGGAVTAIGGAAASSGGVRGNNITISGGAVTATGGAAEYSYGVFSGSGVTISGGTVTATGGAADYSSGVDGDNITISGGDVTATGGAAEGESYGIYAYTSIEISGGAVTATGGEANDYSYGVYNYQGDITFSGGVTIARAGTHNGSYDSANRYAVYGNSGITLPSTKIAGAVGYESGNFGMLTNPIIIDDRGSKYIGSGTTTATGAVIVPSGWTEAAALPAAANDVHNVTADTYIVNTKAEAVTMTGDKTIRVDPGKTLLAVSLNETAYSYGIHSSGKITVEGEGEIIAIGGAGNGPGIYSNNGLNVTATGVVTAIGASSGIYGGSEVTSAGTVTAIGGPAGTGRGFQFGTTMNVTGGRLVAISSPSTRQSCGILGIDSDNSLTISGGAEVVAIGSPASSKSCGMEIKAITLGGNGVAIGSERAFSYEPAADAVATTGAWDGKVMTWSPKPTPSTVATPTITPNGGTYTNATSVTLSCTTDGATIRYTTDGNDPTSTSTEYTAPFTVSSSCTVKAKAFKSSMTDSAVASAAFTINTSSPSGGGRSSTPTVTYNVSSEAAGNAWTQNSPAGFVFKSNGDFKKLQSVAVDGNTLSDDNYTAVEGSTIITLKPAYLNTLPAGKHTLRVKFKDGYAQTTFTVAAAAATETPAEWANPFADVSANDWFYPSVQTVVQAGLFEGTGATAFEPQTPMTRAMFVTVLWRLAGEPGADSRTNFTDVTTGAWYAEAVGWAAMNEIVTGTGDAAFSPDDVITREQMATILYRYQNGAPIAAALSFSDASAVSDWAAEAVAWASAQKLFTGYPDGTFKPQNTATRAEVATVFARLL